MCSTVPEIRAALIKHAEPDTESLPESKSGSQMRPTVAGTQLGTCSWSRSQFGPIIRFVNTQNRRNIITFSAGNGARKAMPPFEIRFNIVNCVQNFVISFSKFHWNTCWDKKGKGVPERQRWRHEALAMCNKI